MKCLSLSAFNRRMGGEVSDSIERIRVRHLRYRVKEAPALRQDNKKPRQSNKSSTAGGAS
jgi:hypothetical protein